VSGAGGAHLDVEVPTSLQGVRVDRALSLLSGVSRRAAAEALAGGRVRLDGSPVRARGTLLRSGQRLEASLVAAGEDRPCPDASVAFEVVYADEDLVVVDKPAGLVVHHGAGHRGGTLVDGLLARFPDLEAMARAGDPSRPGIVHRLDKGTSGLLVVARSPAAWEVLAAQMRRHEAERRYLALVAGSIEADAGEIDAPVGRSARRRDRMAVSASGRPARTAYRVRRRYGAPVPASLLEVSLQTGRTHQVRVHLAAIGHPVVGDDRYGGAGARPPQLHGTLGPGRLFLHAFELVVTHPDGRRLAWRSPLPAELDATLARLEAT
jgi:23S rRNA pseudouridine1911/1915/1917 synthase